MDALTRTDWLDHALGVLARDGYGAMRALPLAKSLGVTRGSFYWHFESLEVFHTTLIGHWSDQTTGQLVAGLDQVASLDDRLRLLLRQTLRSGADLERAMRSWAIVSADVAAEVQKVDAERIAYAEALLMRIGVPSVTVGARARLLYWAAIGRLMMPDPAKHVLADAEVDALAALVAKGHPD